MKIEKLKEGQIFKNYKELCTELEIPVKTGNAKKSQMNELDRYCLLRKDGHKLIVQEVFDVPHPKNNGNIVYGELLVLLITDTLIDKWKKTGDHTVLMTRNSILQDTRMINQNYSFCSVNVVPLSNFLKINTETVSDFFNSTNSSFRHAVESSLRELRNRSLIMYNQATMICDESNKHHKSSPQEEEFILTAEKEILETLGYNSITQARNSRNWELFKREVKNKLSKSDYQIKYYYTSYEITLNTTHIEDNHNRDLISLIENINCQEERSNMNSIICNRLLENAKNRSIKPSTNAKLSTLRNSSSYLQDNQLLIDTLIVENVSDVKDEVYKHRAQKPKGF